MFICKRCKAHDFFDYGEMLDYFYKKFPNGTIQNNQVFSVSSEHPTKMIVKTTNFLWKWISDYQQTLIIIIGLQHSENTN